MHLIGDDFYMKGFVQFLLIATLCSNFFIVNVKGDIINRQNNNIHFNILAPKNVEKDWRVHVQSVPNGRDPSTHKVIFRFMDQKHRYLILGMEESKQQGTHLSVPKGGEKVHFNGQTGFFIKWENSGETNREGKSVSGGLLEWNQDGTHIKMASAKLTKSELIKLAASCQPLSD
jgi:hypothetical protein